jgi:hypothetical protein
MTDDNPAGVDPGWQSDVPVHLRENLDAVLYPPVSGDDPAGVGVAGAYVGVWVTPDCELDLSLELGEAAAWLRRPGGTVRVRLRDAAGTLFIADVMPAPPASGEDAGKPPGKVIPLPRRHGRPGHPAQ